MMITGLLDPKVKPRLDPNHLYSEKNIEHPVILDNLDFKSMLGGYPEIKTDNLRVAENDILISLDNHAILLEFTHLKELMANV